MIEPTPSGSWVTATAKPNIPSDREFNLELNGIWLSVMSAFDTRRRKEKGDQPIFSHFSLFYVIF